LTHLCHSTINSRNSVVICGPQAEEGSALGDASATSPILAIKRANGRASSQYNGCRSARPSQHSYP